MNKCKFFTNFVIIVSIIRLLLASDAATGIARSYRSLDSSVDATNFVVLIVLDLDGALLLSSHRKLLNRWRSDSI
jgi:hypothetical protein